MTTSRNFRLKRYLGDGVYAGYEPDSGSMWLWTINGRTEINMIALEPEVRVAVSQYFHDALEHIASRKVMVREL
jgi:hypothetical protein